MVQCKTLVGRFGVAPELFMVCGKLWLEYLKKIAENGDLRNYVLEPQLRKYEQQVEYRERRRKIRIVAASKTKSPKKKDEPDAERSQAQKSVDESAREPECSDDEMDISAAAASAQNSAKDAAPEVESEEEGDHTAGDASTSEPAAKRRKITEIEPDSTLNDSQASQDASTLSLIPKKRSALAMTLAFLVLGCRWLRERYLVSDIVRWARAGDIMYLAARTLLPGNVSVKFGRLFQPLARYL